MHSQTYKPKSCQKCGTSFVPKSPRTVYCSDECKNPSQTCELCKQPFQPKGNTTGKYCSLKCWYQVYDAQNEKTCVVCGNKFSGHSKQKTCGKECANQSLRTASRATHCAYCKKPLVKNCHPRVQYCSKSCAMNNRIVHGGGQAKPNGSRRSHSTGYTLIKHNGLWIMEHRVVMEQKLGRPLHPRERIHHKNGDRKDNRPENLELWALHNKTKKDPAGSRVEDLYQEALAKILAIDEIAHLPQDVRDQISKALKVE